MTTANQTTSTNGSESCNTMKWGRWTRGPWTVKSTDFMGCYLIHQAEKSNGWQVDEANVRLIAAAPRLLDELVKADRITSVLLSMSGKERGRLVQGIHSLGFRDHAKSRANCIRSVFSKAM